MRKYSKVLSFNTLRSYFPIVGLLSLMVFSCSSAPVRKDINKELPIPQEWASLDNSKNENVIKENWWSDFNDSGLNEVVNETLMKNHNLKIAAANVNMAAAQARIAGAPLLPTADAGFSSSRRKQNFIGLPIPGMDGKVISKTNDTYGVSINLSWELDLWGRVRTEHSASLAKLESAKADLWGAKLSLATQTCKIWFAAIEAKKQVELTEATLANLKISTANVKKTL